MKQTNVMRAKEFRQAASASRSGCESSKKAIGVERLRDAPAEWSQQFEALGLKPMSYGVTPRPRFCEGLSVAGTPRVYLICHP
jgi:hypothetical protein